MKQNKNNHSCKYDEIYTKIKEKQNIDLISEPYTDEDVNLFREVDGVKIGQIPETTPEAIRKNELINLWRMRNK